MVDKLMYIPHDVKQNYPFCRSVLVIETINQSKSPKLLYQRIRKRYSRTMGTSVKKTAHSHLSLWPVRHELSVLQFVQVYYLKLKRSQARLKQLFQAVNHLNPITTLFRHAPQLNNPYG